MENLLKHLRRCNAANAVSRTMMNAGPDHEATWGALGRASVLWDGVIHPPRRVSIPNEFARAYTTAQLREFGFAGHHNRGFRKYERRRAGTASGAGA